MGKKIEVVSEFEYLGYWFTTTNTAVRNVRHLVRKAKKAMNTVWGVMKQAKVNKLRKRLTLMESLVNAGALYGVEIWGWKRKEDIERMQGRLVKMVLGVARNTPDYLWKLEAGKRSIEVEAERRAGAYIVEVLKMKEGKWPKVCLKEEIRGIINGNPSRSATEFTDAIREVADGRTVELIRAGTGRVEIREKYFMKGVNRKE